MPWSEGDGLTPTNLNNKLPSGLAYSVKDAAYGAVGDGVTDDTAAIRACYASAGTGAYIVWPRGTYVLSATTTLKLPAYGVTDLSGSSVVATISTLTDVLFDMSDGAVLRNGWIGVGYSGTPANGERCLPVRVGRYDTSDGSGVVDAIIEHLTIDGSNMTTGTNAIAIFGGSRRIRVSDVVIKAQRKIDIGVLCHWSGDDTVTPTTTTHPSDIVLDGIRAESLNSAAFNGTVFLSSCYNVTARNISAVNSRRVIYNFAGDFGNLYAGSSEKSLVGHGFLFENICGENVENVGSVLGRPTSETTTQLPMSTVWLNPQGAGVSAVTNAGLLFQRCENQLVVAPTLTGFNNGILITSGAHHCSVRGGRIWENQKSGIEVTGAALTLDPVGTVISGVYVFSNNTAMNGATGDNVGIHVSRGLDTVVENCSVGSTGNESQFYGIRVNSTATRTRLMNNHVRSVRSDGGVAISNAASADFNALTTGHGNTVASGITQARGGAAIVASFDAGASTVTPPRMFWGATSPTSGQWYQGDVMWRTDPSFGSHVGVACASGGVPGTWLSFGVVGFGSSAITPAYPLPSEASLGFYRSVASTVALSYGTLDLTAAKVSVRTTGASLNSTNVGVNELAIFVGGTSGATLALRSGGTIYYFASSASTVG